MAKNLEKIVAWGVAAVGAGVAIFAPDITETLNNYFSLGDNTETMIRGSGAVVGGIAAIYAATAGQTIPKKVYKRAKPGHYLAKDRERIKQNKLRQYQ